jgi:spore germination protein GerM
MVLEGKMKAMTKRSKKKRKTRIVRALFRMLFMFVALGLVIWVLWAGFGCLFGGNASRNSVTVYFYDGILGSLAPFERQSTETGDKLEAALKELIKGPKLDERAQTTLNPATRVLSVAQNGDVATVNLSSEVKSIPQGVPEKMALHSVVNTLTSFDGIKAVEFLIDNERPTFFGKSFDASGQFEKLETKQGESRDCLLYFPKNNFSFLAIENAPVKNVIDIAEFAALAVKRYIQGPVTPELESILPPSTKVRKVTLSEGMLTVDLSGEAQSLSVGAEGEEVMMQSLLWTLTEIPGVRKVRILVGGKQVDSLAGHIAIIDPLTRLDPDIISETDKIGMKPTLIYLSADMGDGVYLPVPRLRYFDVKGEPLKQALDMLIAGPNEDERDFEIGTCVPPETEITSIKRVKDHWQIDIKLSEKQIQNSTYEECFVRQLILTTTELEKTMGVLVMVNGEVREVLPYGTKIGTPLLRNP